MSNPPCIPYIVPHKKEYYSPEPLYCSVIVSGTYPVDVDCYTIDLATGEKLYPQTVTVKSQSTNPTRVYGVYSVPGKDFIGRTGTKYMLVARIGNSFDTKTAVYIT